MLTRPSSLFIGLGETRGSGRILPARAVVSVWFCIHRRHYIDVERREDGFDRSGPLNSLGEFTSTRGVSQAF